MAELLRSTDAVGTMGETIGILLLHTPAPEATAIIDRLRRRIEDDPLPGSTRPARLILRLGLVTFPTDGTTDATLFGKAEAMIGGTPQQSR
jgi:GGDEF domain-containing protein